MNRNLYALAVVNPPADRKGGDNGGSNTPGTGPDHKPEGPTGS